MTEKLGPLTAISRDLPSDWTDVTDQQKLIVRDGLHEILEGLGCQCNGKKIASDSVATTVIERVKTLAVTRRVDIGVRELAAAAGVDVDNATHAEIITASTSEQVNSLIAYESLITQLQIEAIVTNEEMAVINDEELARHRIIKDPDWHNDLTQFVNRASPHGIIKYNTSTGLYYTETVTLKVDTIRPTVDWNGEIMSWRYEESVR